MFRTRIIYPADVISELESIRNFLLLKATYVKQWDKFNFRQPAGVYDAKCVLWNQFWMQKSSWTVLRSLVLGWWRKSTQIIATL